MATIRLPAALAAADCALVLTAPETDPTCVLAGVRASDAALCTEVLPAGIAATGLLLPAPDAPRPAGDFAFVVARGAGGGGGGVEVVAPPGAAVRVVDKPAFDPLVLRCTAALPLDLYGPVDRAVSLAKTAFADQELFFQGLSPGAPVQSCRSASAEQPCDKAFPESAFPGVAHKSRGAATARHLRLLSASAARGDACAPSLECAGDAVVTRTVVTLDVLLYTDAADSAQSALEQIGAALKTQHTRLLDLFLTSRQSNPTAYHVQPGAVGHALTILHAADGTGVDRQAEQRRAIHEAFQLPTDRPLVRPSNAVAFLYASGAGGGPASGASGGQQRLVNVHESLTHSGISGGKKYLVDGTYEYYHYMQDHFDDDGWGCAYRSLQTLCSWLRNQQYATRAVPTHREIQQTLVDLGDKPAAFVGSTKWIGAFEVNMVLDSLYGVQCRILNVNSGAELADRAREIAMHFEKEGTPVMVGGGVLAYTLLGVDWNDKTGDIRFLILDPHFTGNDELRIVLSKKWCAWHSVDLFKKNAFYNLCMPIRPKVL